jgi:cell division septum initiation protein DivIVA
MSLLEVMSMTNKFNGKMAGELVAVVRTAKGAPSEYERAVAVAKSYGYRNLAHALTGLARVTSTKWVHRAGLTELYPRH